MRTALILARKHGETAFKVVSGPEVPIAKQIERFKTWLAHDDPSIAEAQLWTSDAGITKRAKREHPDAAQAKAGRRAQEEAEFAAAQKAKADKKNPKPPAPAPAPTPETPAATPGTVDVPPPVETIPAETVTEPAPAATEPAPAATEPVANETPATEPAPAPQKRAKK